MRSKFSGSRLKMKSKKDEIRPQTLTIGTKTIKKITQHKPLTIRSSSKLQKKRLRRRKLYAQHVSFQKFYSATLKDCLPHYFHCMSLPTFQWLYPRTKYANQINPIKCWKLHFRSNKLSSIQTTVEQRIGGTVGFWNIIAG